MKTIITKWAAPARVLYDAVLLILTKHLKTVISDHFGKFSQGGLQHHVTYVEPLRLVSLFVD